MCGIAGFLHFEKSRKASIETLKKMTDVIVHRGPDNEGFFVKENIALGHRRLSIIDLSTGDQPMHSDENNITLIFNGEIYNYVELRKELQTHGHVFKTNSDTEVIIKAYEQWGHDCQERFNGCWAFALWDEKKKQLFISRDRIGEKPVFYSKSDESIIFGSEIKALFAYGVPRILRHELTELYLFLTNIPAPHTFFKDIYKLMPGHYLIIKTCKIEEHKYWDLPQIDEEEMLKNKREIYKNFESLFVKSIQIRMRSDVPYGAFLSGGLDSSSIVAKMAELSSHSIQTFTMGFDNKAFDESHLAKLVSDKFQTNHHLLTVNPEAFNDALNDVYYYMDEPFGDSSAIPTSYISKYAAQNVKMVLTGDGGDEVLSGYNSYLGIKISELYRKVPHFIGTKIPNVIENIKRPFSGEIRYLFNKAQNVTTTALLDFNERMIKKQADADFYSIKKLTHNMDCFKIEDYFSDLMKTCSFKQDFYKQMFYHFKHSLPNDYLVKVDRMSMAHSLEARVPFLDPQLIEYMVTVHKDVKMQGWERKSILRNTIGKKLPEALLKAPKKGFGIPLRDWFKDASFESSLNSLSRTRWGLQEDETKRIIDDNISGKKDHGNFIWTLFMLQKVVNS